MTFREKLLAIQRKQRSLVCVGLDTDSRQLPGHLAASVDSVLEFNRAIIDATKDLVCAYKPNLAFYEALGTTGFEILAKTLACIPPGIVTIGDAKRGDIGNTAEQYATALFGNFHFDAITINAYLGLDAVEPFIKDPNHGIFVLALTSNPGSKDFQKLKVGKQNVYERVIRSCVRWNTNDNVGIVVGATNPRELKNVRKLAPVLPVLIPGVGKQGGDLEASVRFGCDKNGEMAVINSSRGILYASKGRDFADAARKEAMKLRDEIRKYQEKFFSRSLPNS